MITDGPSGPPGPLLSAKQAIPPTRPGAVRRARLEDRLGAAASKLSLVVAPAGWGKTSLVSRWAGAAAAAGTPVAWVSLDESDDEPVRFWSYVLTSLARAGAVGRSAGESLSAGGGPMAHALPVVLNELAESPSGAVLVLDDYHVIGDPGVHESLEFFLSYLPSTLRVVIATRADPPLPLARMRVRGELSEVRVEDLRFSRDESAALLAAVASEVEPTVLRQVWEQTEGWAAGLQLAGLTLRARGAVGGRADRHLFDYFTTEVLPALTPAQRDLLVGTAPLELLSGPLCDAALGVEGSAEVLAGLEQADLFVVALDPRREWYRCHRLLRDALTSSSGPSGDVLRRAAAWFAQHRRPDDAVRHLLLAGDQVAAERLLRDEQPWFLENGLAATLLTLAEQLEVSAVHPQLALQLAYAADIGGRRDRVVHWLDVGRRHTGDDTVVHGWRSARAAELALRGAIGTPDDEAEHRIELCERALALEGEGSVVGHPSARGALGFACGLAGRLEEAVEILAGSWRRRGQGNWSTSLDLQVAGLLSVFLLRLGRIDRLDRVIAEAGPLADAAERDWGDAAANVVAPLRLAQGGRSYLAGDLVRAAAQVGHGLALAGIAGRPSSQTVGLVFTAEIEHGLGNRAAARAALGQARELVGEEPAAPLVLTILAEAEARIGRADVRAAAGTGSLVEELTDREMSILRMLPGSASQREIGAALFISLNTVKAYNRNLYRKLGVGGRADAVRAARRLGLI